MEGHHGVIYRLTMLLHPLSELAEAGRQALAQHAHVLRLPPKARLHAQMEQRWITYVLKGEVAIQGPGGFTEHIPAGSARARRPLFEHIPIGLEAVTRTGTIVLRFERAQVGSLIAAQQKGSAPVELAAKVLLACRSAPTMGGLPAAAHRMDVLLEKEARLKDLARAVSELPELEYGFLAAVNRGHGDPIRTSAEAVLRMGMPASRALLLCLVLRPLFHARDPGLRQRMDQIYEHSLFVGCLAYALARQHPSLCAERALFAGLLHDAGMVAVLGVADADPDLGLSAAELDHLLRRLRTLTGPVLLSKLGLGDYTHVAEHAERWSRATSQLDLVDLVTLAHLFESTQPSCELPRAEDIPAFHKLGWPQFSPQRAARLVDSARGMAAALQRRMGR